jgi:hypothetical protein
MTRPQIIRAGPSSCNIGDIAMANSIPQTQLTSRTKALRPLRIIADNLLIPQPLVPDLLHRTRPKLFENSQQKPLENIMAIQMFHPLGPMAIITWATGNTIVQERIPVVNLPRMAHITNSKMLSPWRRMVALPAPV